MMRKYVNIFWRQICLPMVLAAFLPAFANAQPVLDLELRQERYALGKVMYFYEDAGGQSTIEQVSDPAFAWRFKPAEKDALNFGVTSSSIWVRFALRNQASETLPNWLLALDYPLFDYVTLYRKDVASGAWTAEESGDMFPFRKRRIAHRNFLFELSLPDTLVSVYYLRIASSGSVQISPHVYTDRQLASENMSFEIAFGLFYGAMLIMLLYNLFLYVSLKDRAYLAYVLVILFNVLVQAAFSGHVNQYILGNYPLLANLAIPFFMTGAGLAMNFFAISFLETRRFAPGLHRFLLVLMLLLGLDMALIPFLSIRLTISFAGMLIMATSLAMIATGVKSLLSGNKAARFFLLAWVLLLVGVLITSLRNFGLLAPNFWTINSIKIGSLMEVVLLSMALSDKYRLFREEKEAAQAKVLHMQQESNRLLEEKVVERTMQLAEANAQLSSTLEIIEVEREKSDRLLLNILPEETAAELKEKGYATPRHYDLVSVLFTDFKDFTGLAERLPPQQLIDDLSYCFSAFDEICAAHNLEKIKTIGDSYMAVGGLPTPNQTNAEDAVRAALAILDWTERWQRDKEAKGEEPWQIRIGVHSGPVVAGVVGKSKFAYDIWGDTVNLASRMESAGIPGQVNISAATYEQVKDFVRCSYRGEIEVKNKGNVKMYAASLQG